MDLSTIVKHIFSSFLVTSPSLYLYGAPLVLRRKEKTLVQSAAEPQKKAPPSWILAVETTILNNPSIEQKKKNHN